MLWSPPLRDPFNYNQDPLARARHPDDRDRAALAPGRRGKAGRDRAVRRALRRLVERRHPEHRGVSQHDRDSHRDDRQPDADARAARDGSADTEQRSDVPGAAAGMALPEVDRLFRLVQPRRARHGGEDEGELPLQPLRDGEELGRPRQPGHLDRGAAPVRRIAAEVAAAPARVAVALASPRASRAAVAAGQERRRCGVRSRPLGGPASA